MSRFIRYSLAKKLFVLQGHAHTLIELILQLDNFQHIGGGRVCSKTFKCQCISEGGGDNKPVLLLSFTELLFILHFYHFAHVFFLLFSLDVKKYSRPWNRWAFLLVFFKKRSSQGSQDEKRGASIKLPTYHSGGWVPCCVGRMIKSYLRQMNTAVVPQVQPSWMWGGLLLSQHCLIKTQSNEILPQ